MTPGPDRERLTLPDVERDQLTEDFAGVLLISYTLAELMALEDAVSGRAAGDES